MENLEKYPTCGQIVSFSYHFAVVLAMRMSHKENNRGLQELGFLIMTFLDWWGFILKWSNQLAERFYWMCWEFFSLVLRYASESYYVNRAQPSTTICNQIHLERMRKSLMLWLKEWKNLLKYTGNQRFCKTDVVWWHEICLPKTRLQALKKVMLETASLVKLSGCKFESNIKPKMIYDRGILLTYSCTFWSSDLPVPLCQITLFKKGRESHNPHFKYFFCTFLLHIFTRETANSQTYIVCLLAKR